MILYELLSAVGIVYLGVQYGSGQKNLSNNIKHLELFANGYWMILMVSCMQLLLHQIKRCRLLVGDMQYLLVQRAQLGLAFQQEI